MYDYFTCHDINIVVPHGKLASAVEWMESYGCDGITPVLLQSRTAPPCRSASACPSKPGEVFQLATISESIVGIAHAVVSSPITGEANLVTSSRVYSFYPNTITTQYVLRTDWIRIRTPRRTSSPYTVMPSNYSWKPLCGNLCPAVQRNTIGDKGVASFVFDSSRDTPKSRYEDTDYLLAGRVIIWRFGQKCSNLRCPNYTPDFQSGVMLG
ncbi:hypothetical protein DFP72DRAFT_1071762 [Ephemerocybe angulata]|uniref:Uncharacterized protein n=1 Tax=Ephemerocybe angulata TaxID=980116 RepID=A0A8H6HR65_9AGAR|nr:hypothetical protein DFP72DRAFT_1071762 [Tulosesus angulatus]